MKERRNGKERRKVARRLVDQTIPPRRIWCCPETQEALEHHLGNSLLALGVFLSRMEQKQNLLPTVEQQMLKSAHSQLRRLQSTRASLHLCGFAAQCPMRRQKFGRIRSFFARWVLGKQKRSEWYGSS